MAAAIEVRAARREDAETIQRLLEALAANLGGKIAGSVADIERFGFGERPRFEAFVARGASGDVGLLLGFAEYSSWRGRPGFYVQDLYVDPAARGQGVARALLAHAARRTGAAGGGYLRLSADAGNVLAHAFYLKTGFRAADKERIFVLDGAAFEAMASDPAEGAEGESR